MHLSAMLTSLPLPFADAARLAAELGFTHVDVVAVVDRPADELEALAETGLAVSCAALGRGLPEGQTLDAAKPEPRRAALEAMKRQLADAAILGATTAYVVPGFDASREALLCFGDSLRLLAEHAGQRMVRLCLEPVPGRALPTAASVLRFLDELNHPNLTMLLDIGHCLISREDGAAVIRAAGPRLGYAHLDDNDGVGDLHWPLLSGTLTRNGLRDFIQALASIGYDGALGLELNPSNADPTAALRDGRKLVLGELQ
jgi:sugar phosphate isomerase/epimerase